MSGTGTRTIIITGAARGIGLAACQRFVREGWNVVGVDIRSADLEQNLPDEALPIDCDVSQPDQVARAVAKALDHFGRIDALVNNAGIADFGPLLDTDFATWRKIMATNLDGPFLMSQAVAPHMLTSGGAIVNITSISGHRASTLRVAYGTSKAGLKHLTEQLAAELGEYGIRVNAIAPGPVNTAMALKVHDDVIRRAYHDAIPLNRYGSEEEIANAIYFLCSEEASYITGQCLSVDGGFQSTGIGLPALRQ